MSTTKRAFQKTLQRISEQQELSDITERRLAAELLQSSMAEEIRQLRQEIAAVREEAAPMRGQIADLERHLTATNERFATFYHSRIWQTLVWCGGLLLVFLKSVRGLVGWLRNSPGLVRKASRRMHPEQDHVFIYSDYPSSAVASHLRTGEEIRGWVCAESGIASMEIVLNGSKVAGLRYGVKRPDVQKHLPSCRNSRYSGYLAICNIDGLPAGAYEMKIRVRAKSGREEELVFPALVDERDERLATFYRSRIWQILAWRGGLLLVLLKSVRSLVGWLRNSPGLVRKALGRMHPEQDHVVINSDYPSSAVASRLRTGEEIRGWVCAKSGIVSMEILLNGARVADLHYGVERSDVEEHLPSYRNSRFSGYRAICNIDGLPAGAYEMKIRARAKSGREEVVVFPALVDERSDYEIWIANNEPDVAEKRRLRQSVHLFLHKPLISIVTPVYRTPKCFLHACVESVLNQIYDRWELILVDDGSQDPDLSAMLEHFQQLDDRIKIKVLPSNVGIALATNEGLAECQGEYVGFLDHDDMLADTALYEVAAQINVSPDVEILYSDEDKITPQGKRVDCFCKPEWSPDLFHSVNYICHFLVCRLSLLREAGGLRAGYDGSQDYDLALRLTERTERIHRIPKVLYHWRISETSTASATAQKPQASNAGLKALNEHLARMADGAYAEELFPSHYRVRYPVRGNPEVLIVIPTGGNPMLKKALQSLLKKTSYRNFRVAVVDNSKGDKVVEIMRRFRNSSRPVTTLDCRNQPFNFSLLCNRGARSTDSPYVLFLNDDTSVINADWLEAMLEHAQRPEIGAVGPLLLFPDGRIQHAGVLLGIYGLAAHGFRLLDPKLDQYFHLHRMIRNASAVTGACLLMRRQVFEEVDGFNEEDLPTCFQDVDLCLKLHEKGYRIVYTPHAKMFHYESASKKVVAFESEIEYMKERWIHYIQDDPYYSPNLTRNSESYILRI
jgi:GT2 family glycosyltransferase